MGFYFRKSVKFGPMRVNFSKSGVGFSGGVKGLRIGKGPKGNYIHAGRNGFYYKKAFGNGKQKVLAPIPQPQENNQNIYDFKDIESKDISNLIDSSSDDLLKEINEKNKKIRLWIVWTIISSLLSVINPGFIAFFVLLPIFFYIDKRRKSVLLIYDITPEKERQLQNFYDVFWEVVNANKKWHVQSSANLNEINQRKINAGAGNIMRRNEIKISFSSPPYFITNVQIPKIPLGKKTLYFFPDRVLVFQGKQVGSIMYSSLKINYSNTSFIETSIVPRDTRIIGSTWRYVNKDGGPDRRFSNNRQLPIVEYSSLLFSSLSGLNEMIHVSIPDIGIKVVNALESMKVNEM
ncbi:MAG: hypothetical protein BWY74_00800 [Firmicutes bacterium ADurb.Bin419]|nr:MAG: hypothetical protein BWY74_00800 [Firmicutes bacterium ADurb.Bin419]